MNKVVTQASRKNWGKEEIEAIKQLRQNGEKYKNIGKKFGMSENAVRKAMYRFSPEYQKQITHVEKFSQYVSFHRAIEWGIEQGVFDSYLNTDLTKVNKNSMKNMTKAQILIAINKFRLKSNLQPFFLKTLDT